MNDSIYELLSAEEARHITRDAKEQQKLSAQKKAVTEIRGAARGGDQIVTLRLGEYSMSTIDYIRRLLREQGYTVGDDYMDLVVRW